MITMQMKVKINGECVGVCSYKDLIMLGASVHVFDRNPSGEKNEIEASFGGIIKKPDSEKREHIDWFRGREISAGDTVEIQFVEIDEAELINKEIDAGATISEVDYP